LGMRRSAYYYIAQRKADECEKGLSGDWGGVEPTSIQRVLKRGVI